MEEVSNLQRHTRNWMLNWINISVSIGSPWLWPAISTLSYRLGWEGESIRRPIYLFQVDVMSWCRVCVQKGEEGWAYSFSLDRCPGDPACTLHASCGRWGACGPWCLREDRLHAACHQPGTCIEQPHSHKHPSQKSEAGWWRPAAPRHVFCQIWFCVLQLC